LEIKKPFNVEEKKAELSLNFERLNMKSTKNEDKENLCFKTCISILHVSIGRFRCSKAPFHVEFNYLLNGDNGFVEIGQKLIEI
jgi:hypothetical protein